MHKWFATTLVSLVYSALFVTFKEWSTHHLLRAKHPWSCPFNPTISRDIAFDMCPIIIVHKFKSTTDARSWSLQKLTAPIECEYNINDERHRLGSYDNIRTYPRFTCVWPWNGRKSWFILTLCTRILLILLWRQIAFNAFLSFIIVLSNKSANKANYVCIVVFCVVSRSCVDMCCCQVFGGGRVFNFVLDKKVTKMAMLNVNSLWTCRPQFFVYTTTFLCACQLDDKMSIVNNTSTRCYCTGSSHLSYGLCV